MRISCGLVLTCIVTTLITLCIVVMLWGVLGTGFPAAAFGAFGFAIVGFVVFQVVKRRRFSLKTMFVFMTGISLLVMGVSTPYYEWVESVDVSIKIIVVDATDGVPVANANVRVTRHNEPAALADLPEAVTDSSGEAEIVAEVWRTCRESVIATRRSPYLWEWDVVVNASGFDPVATGIGMDQQSEGRSAHLLLRVPLRKR